MLEAGAWLVRVCVCVHTMRQVKRRERGSQWHNSNDEATQWPVVCLVTRQTQTYSNIPAVNRATNEVLDYEDAQSQPYIWARLSSSVHQL